MAQILKRDVIIIGGGAAGLMAASRLLGSDLDVLLLEKEHQCGRKILITGKGRCNITNMKPWSEFSTHIHPDANFFKFAFWNFTNEDVLNYFNSLGLPTKVERGERAYPQSDRSHDVRDVLVRNIRSKIDIQTNTRVLNITKQDDLFCIEALEGDREIKVYSKYVVLATGGLSYPSTGSTGDGYKIAQELGAHKIEATLPSLTALTPVKYDHKLLGVTLKNVKLSLSIENKIHQEEFGELSFTDGGIEGALGFRLSRKAVIALNKGQKVELVLDLKPSVSEEQLSRRIEKEFLPSLRLENFLRSLMPRDLINPFMASFPRLNKSTLASSLKSWVFPITSYVGYQRCVITSGGVSLKDISRKTMESRKVENLYLIGEMINLDADTGGYNLQIAFSTAATAVLSIIAKEKGEE